jgi:gentisate 1,2-dioxygenase
VRNLEATFYEDFPEDQQPVTKVVDESEHRYGAGTLKPAWEEASASWSPLLHYRWDRTHEALHQLAQVAASPFDDVALEYTNPANGGPVLRTMACWVQLITPGVRTQAHRQTSSAVYYVVKGQGHSVINGQRFDWTEKDMFVVPPWSWHEHANETGNEAILFSIQDIPVLRALGLYREEAYKDNGGHQPVTSHFTGL